MKRTVVTFIAVVFLIVSIEARPNFKKNKRQNQRAQQGMMWRHLPQPLLIWSNQWEAPKQPFGYDTRRAIRKAVKSILN